MEAHYKVVPKINQVWRPKTIPQAAPSVPKDTLLQAMPLNDTNSVASGEVSTPVCDVLPDDWKQAKGNGVFKATPMT